MMKLMERFGSLGTWNSSTEPFGYLCAIGSLFRLKRSLEDAHNLIDATFGEMDQ
jgi:hypothetical protein